MFIASVPVRWCYYKESSQVLGQTFGMAVLQDFEALTPNLLCRTLETVEGGGLAVLLLRTMSSLKQLYTLAMDVHARFRTGAHADVVGRFNERFLLSLCHCRRALVLDDELNVLPVSRWVREVPPAAGAAAGAVAGTVAGAAAGAEGSGGAWASFLALRATRSLVTSSGREPLVSRLASVS